jgi:hypothetical protein
MESTVSLFPGNPELRSRVKFPLGLSFSPTQDSSSDLLPYSLDDLVTCRSCGSFLSPNSPIDSATWTCVFCGSPNRLSDTPSFVAQSNKSSVEICLGTKPEVGLIHVLYFSTAFSDPAARVFLFGLLRALPDAARALLFLGSDASDISLLVPSGNAEAAVVRFPAIGGLVSLDLSKFFFSKANEIEA